MNKRKKEKYYETRKLGIRKILIITFIIILIISGIISGTVYIVNEGFRNWVDINILRKDIKSEDVASIDLDADKNNQIFCFNKYVCILNDKNLKIYNTLGENISEISVDINKAIFDSNDKYLAIAEKNGQEICVILDKTYLWRQKVDGEILQIHVNKNGYIALVTTDTTYKSIITVYDSAGNELLKKFLSSTRVIDVAISNDNKNVAFAEIDTSGTLIQSNIEVLSIEKVKENSEDSIIYSHNADVSKMIVKLKYQDEGKLVCVYDDSINIINNGQEKELVKLKKENTFASGNFVNAVAYITEETSGLFNSKSILNIVNTDKEQTYTYNFEEVAKEMYAIHNVIGINTGTEIYFINTNGMLIKKYISKQEITNVMLQKDLAIVIYKDRIEIIDL